MKANIHASCVAYKNQGILFLGQSGSGKSDVCLRLIMEHGANSVRAIASHAVMSDPASTRVDNSKLKEIIFTDSIPYSQKSEKVKILSVADMFADSIMRVCNNESISSLYVV